MELKTIAILIFLPAFVFAFVFGILIQKFQLKHFGKENVSVWTGIDKNTKKLAISQYKNKKEFFNESKLGLSLIIGVLFSNKYSEKYPSDIKKLRIFGYPALILIMISMAITFIVVFSKV